jgi:hypothetical protein
MDKNKILDDPCHLWVPTGASKMISDPMVYLVQTMHLSGARVRPKQFLSLWYVRRKPCSYLAPTLTTSPNRLKWDSTWSTSPRNSIGCVQNYFEPLVRSTQTMHLSCIKISTISKWTKRSFQLSLVTYQGVSSSSSKMISEPKVRLVQIVHLSCIQMDRNGIPHDSSHVGVPFGVSKMISEPMIRSVQKVQLSCVKINTISKQTKRSFQLSLIT